MVNDLVERLRANATLLGDDHYSDLMEAAAARIKQLESALKQAVQELEEHGDPLAVDIVRRIYASLEAES